MLLERHVARLEERCLHSISWNMWRGRALYMIIVTFPPISRSTVWMKRKYIKITLKLFMVFGAQIVKLEDETFSGVLILLTTRTSVCWVRWIDSVQKEKVYLNKQYWQCTCNNYLLKYPSTVLIQLNLKALFNDCWRIFYNSLQQSPVNSTFHRVNIQAH